MCKLAPLVIFVYKREGITAKMLNAINRNFLAEETDVYIFSDGAKGISDEEDVSKVRKLIRDFKENSNFKNVTIIESDRNKGLANSIIEGVTKVINEYGKVIVLEDDLLTANNFLKFMNDCLSFYENEKDVWSIGGLTFKLPHFARYKYDVYACYRASSWGWASWKNRWDMVDWNVSDYQKFKKSIRRRFKLKRGGQDMAEALDRQMMGQTDSWAIRWCYCESKNNMVTILPKKSFVKHIGWGDTATHAKEADDIYHVSIESENFHYELERVAIDERLMRDFRKYYSKIYYFCETWKGSRKRRRL